MRIFSVIYHMSGKQLESVLREHTEREQICVQQNKYIIHTLAIANLHFIFHKTIAQQRVVRNIYHNLLSLIFPVLSIIFTVIFSSY